MTPEQRRLKSRVLAAAEARRQALPRCQQCGLVRAAAVGFECWRRECPRASAQTAREPESHA